VSRTDDERVADILDNCRRLRDIALVGEEKFLADEVLQDAACYRVTVIGEALNNLSDDFAEQHPDLEIPEARGMRTDYEQAGMTYDRPGLRIDRLIESLEIIRGYWAPGPFDFASEHYTITGYDGHPKPWTESGPPIIIGGGGPRMLGVAAEHADIVGVTANLRAGEVGVDAIADSMPAAYDRKLARLRECAGDRIDDLEISSLTMNTTITDDRDAALGFFAEMFNTSVDDVAQTPALLAGSVSEIVETLQERRERWGFNYVVVQQDGGQGMEQFPKVVAALAGT